MHDASFDDTLLVPRLPTIDSRPRRFAPTFAPARTRKWPWVVAAIALACAALTRPIDAHAFDQARTRAANAHLLLERLGR